MRTHLIHTFIAPLSALALVLGTAGVAAASPIPTVVDATFGAAPAADALDPAATDDEHGHDHDDEAIAGTGYVEGSALARSTTQSTYPAATTFARPLAAKSYYVSSFYGGRCITLPGSSTMHQGIDLAAAGGSPIYAVAAGRVTHTVNGSSSVTGYITIEHRVGTDIYQSRYLHVWSATTHVRVGDVVKAGQQIGLVGSSGGSTGNHLHLEWWRGPWGAASSTEPAAFLKTRSVDLLGDAIAVSAKPVPTTCTYYATTGVNFRTGPSTSSTVIRLLAQGTQMTHVPGQISGGFIPVTIGSQSGWVSSSYVSTNRPATPPPAPSPTPAPTPKPTPSPTPTPTPAPASASLPGPFLTSLNAALRAGPSSDTVRLRVAWKGGYVGKPLAADGDWRKFSYRGTIGWIHVKNIDPVPYATTVNAALRSGPSSDSPRLRVAWKGGSVGAVLATKGDWSKFLYRGTTGWIHVKNVVAVGVEIPPTQYVTIVNAALRAGPSSDTVRLRVAWKGGSVGAVQEIQGDWRKVTYQGTTGWIHVKNLAAI